MISVGSVIGGRLRIDQVLGAGGMGIVLAATHLELGHRVAIKLLRDEMAQSPAIVERFLREARAVVGLRTEHVCRVIDVGRLETGAPYIVMEMLEGVDLQRSVAKAPLPITTAVEYILQACVALTEAHAAGIIHRDLKPANLFVTRRFDGGPLVKVLDFGIAKALTEPGAHLTHQSAMGSPGYMSPEQIQSARDVDVRTDLWALGVTLYQLLAARLPFPGANPTEIAIAVANDPPAPIEIDPALRAVIWKCLEKQPDRRYSSIGELMLALQPFGGPNARTFVGQASQLTFGAVRAPATEPLVSTVSMTQATLGMTTGQAVIVPAKITEPAPVLPARRRWWPVVLVVGAGAAIAGVMYTQRSEPRVAAPIVITQERPIDAAPAATVPAIDARASANANDPWAAKDDGPALPILGDDDDFTEAGEPAATIDAAIPPAGKAVKRHAPAEDPLAQAMTMQRLVAPCTKYQIAKIPDSKGFFECVCKQPGAAAVPEFKSICAN